MLSKKKKNIEKCSVCKDEVKSKKLESYSLKDRQTGEEICLLTCNDCLEFFLNVYLENPQICQLLVKAGIFNASVANKKLFKC